MMETLNAEEETINYAKVSDLVSRLLDAMATQFHAQLSRENLQECYKITMLDSHEIPDISIKDYLYRIVTMSRCMYRDLIVALVYADKLINSEVISGISYHNVHRLMAVSMMLSTKFYEDVHFSNKSWASISGLSLQELNMIEVQFLEALGYDLNISLEAMQHWSQAVSSFADENLVQERERHFSNISTDSHISSAQSVDVDTEQFC